MTDAKPKVVEMSKNKTRCSWGGCRRPPSRDSPYCFFHKGEVSKNLRAKAMADAKSKARRIEEERLAALLRRQREARAEARERRYRKQEVWLKRQPKLRAIAEEVFSDIESFTIDLDDEKLIISRDFPTFVRTIRYDKALTRSYASFRRKMEDDKEWWNNEVYDGPPPRNVIRCRNSWCSAPVSYSRMWGYGQYCVNCETDDS